MTVLTLICPTLFGSGFFSFLSDLLRMVSGYFAVLELSFGAPIIIFAVSELLYDCGSLNQIQVIFSRFHIEPRQWVNAENFVGSAYLQGLHLPL
jgi:hypothetical protein